MSLRRSWRWPSGLAQPQIDRPQKQKKGASSLRLREEFAVTGGLLLYGQQTPSAYSPGLRLNVFACCSCRRAGSRGPTFEQD